MAAAAGGAVLTADWSNLTGWVPFSVRAGEAPPRVGWCHLGEQRFTAPFFKQTIDACLRRPFNQLFARETPIDVLLDLQRVRPGLAPTAFIFHCSRCGSTLYSQLAAALPQAIAISEAPPIDQVLRAAAPDPARIEWLRALLGALGQPRRAGDRYLFVKFDAWHIAQLPLVQRAFPGVPCLFLYRNPVEVLASQLRMPGTQMIPGALDASITGIDVPTLLALSREDQCRRMLEWLFAAGLEHVAARRVAPVNYTELPDAAIRQLLDWCQLPERGDLRRTLEDTARFDAKTPSLHFSSRDAPTTTASADAAGDRLTRIFEQLEACRRAQL
jgi:hypothetical protein